LHRDVFGQIGLRLERLCQRIHHGKVFGWLQRSHGEACTDSLAQGRAQGCQYGVVIAQTNAMAVAHGHREANVHADISGRPRHGQRLIQVVHASLHARVMDHQIRDPVARTPSQRCGRAEVRVCAGQHRTEERQPGL